ncbi:Polyamine transporter 4 [Penicillium atrosanguineum]|uniref:Polyamine transporter 4 n=1 Tax=Penicillium atrosanguineum TaxID=1132637 RepID=A0A9W9PR57_9EURO|nr:Polyamine transporter 4 [Penicillium atrosanguineum]
MHPNHEKDHTNPNTNKTLTTDITDWSYDKTNPRNWTTLRKTISTLIICSIGFITTLGASIYSPGHTTVQNAFHTSTTVSLLPLSAYSLGLAFGPMISSPCSETFGRKFVYLFTLPLFDIFMLGSGLSRNIASLIICRFLAGLFAAPGVSVAAATISDFTEPADRVIPLAMYYSVPFIGSAIGPLIGGFVVQERGWRWTAWVVLVMAAVFHPCALFLRESYETIILQKRARKMGVEVRKGDGWVKLRTLVTSTIVRPVHMLLTEPLVGFLCLYTGFQFALLYTFVVASPWVFKTVYGFSLGAQGLSFLGLVVGCLVAPVILITVNRALKRHHPVQQDGSFNPERKLYTALYGSLVLPVALFWFGWTAKSSIHWISPIVAQGMALLGSILIYVPCNFYMLDVYGSKYGASASGASSLSRYTLSAAFPLFVTQMYEGLGVGWATSVLGFTALIMAPIPWLFYWVGPRLRARSAYEHGT